MTKLVTHQCHWDGLIDLRLVGHIVLWEYNNTLGFENRPLLIIHPLKVCDVYTCMHKVIASHHSMIHAVDSYLVCG